MSKWIADWYLSPTGSEWGGIMAHTTIMNWESSVFERSGLAVRSKGWLLTLTDVD